MKTFKDFITEARYNLPKDMGKAGQKAVNNIKAISTNKRKAKKMLDSGKSIEDIAKHFDIDKDTAEFWSKG